MKATINAALQKELRSVADIIKLNHTVNVPLLPASYLYSCYMNCEH